MGFVCVAPDFQSEGFFYLALQQIISELYAQADAAIAADDYNDASLLTSQADKLYQMAENLEIIIAEQE